MMFKVVCLETVTCGVTFYVNEVYHASVPQKYLDPINKDYTKRIENPDEAIPYIRTIKIDSILD